MAAAQIIKFQTKNKNKNTELILHSFETGRRGKPDELDAQIANLIGVYFLERDPDARFDIRVEGGAERGELFVNVSGEVTEDLLDPKHKEDVEEIVLGHYNLINKTDFSRITTYVRFTPQSTALAHNDCTGDISTALAVAYADTPNYLPLERWLAVAVRDALDEAYFNQHPGFQGLKADGKISVNVLYESPTKIKSIDNIIVAANHEPSLSLADLRASITTLVKNTLSLKKLSLEISSIGEIISINGLGAWTDEGGWYVDRGSREAKPPRDGFGSYGMVEDSFSGEDPSKPSATATFLARYIAVQIAGNSLADFARVGLCYNIGEQQPKILNIFTNGTGRLYQSDLENWIKDQLSDLSIAATIDRFGLRDAELYRKIVSSSDFFQDQNLPWNKLELKI